MHPAAARDRSDTPGWLEMVKGHHEAISRSFDALLDDSDVSRLRRDSLLRTLAFQMTAHAVAEENALYPALAVHGLLPEADRLYMDHAHFKVQLAMMQAAEAGQRSTAEWLVAVRKLRDVALTHARKDEEETLFPRLALLLDDRDNQSLALTYEREYGQVRGVASQIS
ncbi:hemerythrin domain-containing protein [Caldimonas sp. KR1-144]|uniref:hemerythrin domain-containing protein n=1 Tax=Caldimonas sp. KR1-144 TaxID=3400911 RepID=UPI003BFBB103